jgi:2,3-bisphosphoglycerate-dependent phosphoglycerate mutase
MHRELHLLLLRHGQTDSNAAGIVQGHLPVPLNELGHRQAARLGARLKVASPKIGRLISSDLPRAAQTAQPIARALGLPTEFDPAWRERLLGEFQGRSVGERRTWSLATGEETPTGAESVGEFESRVRAALEAVEPLADGSPVAVVTHGGPVRVVLRMLGDGRLEVDGERPESPPRIENCSILQLHRTREGTWRIACVNDASHLEELRTTTDSG